MNPASCNDLALVYDSKQKGTFVSARWQREYSPDLCWVSSVCGHPQPATSPVLGNFPHSQHRPSVIHIGLTLPVRLWYTTPTKNGGIFQEADGENFTRKTENSIPLIPRQQIAIEEAYTRFMGALSSAAHATIPRGVRLLVLRPCIDEEAAALLQQYEESGDPDIADNLIESLNAARRDRW